jgi:hypothetical protein
MIELEQVLGQELSLTLINEAPTFAGLCKALRKQGGARYVPLVPLKAGEGLPPLFFIPPASAEMSRNSSRWPGE